MRNWTPFKYPHRNLDYIGEFSLTDEALPIITVRTIHGRKATQLGGSPAETLAKMLAGELARDDKG